MCDEEQPLDYSRPRSDNDSRRGDWIPRHPDTEHRGRKASQPPAENQRPLRICRRGDWIRTSDPLRPRQVRYQAALRPDSRSILAVRPVSRQQAEFLLPSKAGYHDWLRHGQRRAHGEPDRSASGATGTVASVRRDPAAEPELLREAGLRLGALALPRGEEDDQPRLAHHAHARHTRTGIQQLVERPHGLQLVDAGRIGEKLLDIHVDDGDL